MTYITISRHDSLWIDIPIMQVHIVDSKRDILDPKIKEKNDHRIYFKFRTLTVDVENVYLVL